MSRVGACFMFILGTACGFPAAAADLPKQGDFSVTFYGHGVFKGIPVGKTRYEASFEEDGLLVGDGLLNRMTVHCFGMAGRTDQIRHTRGFCIATDIDGDQIAMDIVGDDYPNGAKEFTGTGTFAAGTGKYTGITGQNKFVNYPGYFKSSSENAFDVYSPGKGHYQLPQ
jgi:hypothetical protein